ncbi:hypothetical protein HJG60_008616 [Phyllostomus discolor]|uniref:Uncharacterized protein n=1 Tax=Phyllostomus discolor TaxID=89673 RepID=A0A833YY09_9CHIR|nr:hypothetical protein HJG60_008616 [Phyllostomus discolor]
MLHLIDWLSLHHLVFFFSGAFICSIIWVFFFILVYLLCSKRCSLRYLSGWHKPHCCFVVLYVWEGSEKERCHLLSSRPDFSHFLYYPQANWILLVLIARWVGLCRFVGLSRTLWGLSNEHSCVARSFSCFLSPHRIFQLEVLRLYSLLWNPELCGLSCCLFAPPSLSACKCETNHSTSHCFTQSISHHLALPGPLATALP